MAAATTSGPDMGAATTTTTTTLHPNASLVAVAPMGSISGVGPFETSPSQPAPHPLPTATPVPMSASTSTPATPAAGGAAASAAAAAAAAAASASRSVKRPRPVKSCTECRKRKLRCDRNLPCSQCQKSHRNCKYAAEHDSSMMSDGSDVEIGDVQRPPKRNCLPANATPGSHAPESSFVPLRNGESTAHSALEELTSRLDRLEKQFMIKSPAGTEFSGAGQHLPLSPETIRGLTVKRGALRTRFFGQSSVRVLLNLVTCPGPLIVCRLLS